MACKTDVMFVELDIDAGEYLSYRVEYRGGSPTFDVSDATTGERILDPTMGPRTGPFEAVWPVPGQVVELGEHEHVFGAVFTTATEYSLVVKHCRISGSTKAVLKDCTWKVGDVPWSSLTVDAV